MSRDSSSKPRRCAIIGPWTLIEDGNSVTLMHDLGPNFTTNDRDGDSGQVLCRFINDLIDTYVNASEIRGQIGEFVIDMLIFCPKCGTHHVDKPDGEWTNPPHKSHLCHACGHIWRISDTCTNGVAGLTTRGQRDGSPVPVPKCIGDTYLRYAGLGRAHDPKDR